MDEKKVREAIVGLKKAAGRLKANGFKTAGHLDTAIEALEKQLPKKPIVTEDKQFALCPCCNGKGLLDKQIYCDCCGQRIDWSEC